MMFASESSLLRGNAPLAYRRSLGLAHVFKFYDASRTPPAGLLVAVSRTGNSRRAKERQAKMSLPGTGGGTAFVSERAALA